MCVKIVLLCCLAVPGPGGWTSSVRTRRSVTTSCAVRWCMRTPVYGGLAPAHNTTTAAPHAAATRTRVCLSGPVDLSASRSVGRAFLGCFLGKCKHGVFKKNVFSVCAIMVPQIANICANRLDYEQMCLEIPCPPRDSTCDLGESVGRAVGSQKLGTNRATSLH